MNTLAYIHPEAKLGQNVVVEPFSTIYKDVEIGDGTWIGPNVTIFDGARIGKNCKIFPGAVISAIPQDLKFAGEETVAIIGDNTTIRECVTINRGTKTLGKTQVGSNCLLMAYTHIAHDCIVGNNCILANCATLAGHVTIDDFVIIGGVSAIHQFVRIGAHAMISGGSLVRKNVPPFVTAAREPLAYVGINSIGLRRRSFNSETIAQINQIYRLLFVDGMSVSRALEAISEQVPQSEVRDEIVEFVKASSQRGIIKGYSGKSADDE